MWSYYGAKTNIVKLYPKPKHDKIIEPFAGSARYALEYFEKEVLLVDKYEPIIIIWKWLQQCSPKDILDLPRIKAGENINKIKFDCEAARLFMGYCIGFGFTTPRDTATPRLGNRPNQLNYTLNRIAKSLFKIKHWQFSCDSYENVVNEKATWFIDPPYQHGGHAYARNNKKINFPHLAQWSRSRLGQVIVCENTKADWMDFKPFVVQNVRTGKHSEAIWCNEKTPFDNEQIKMAI